MGERDAGSVEVRGSNPLTSTIRGQETVARYYCRATRVPTVGYDKSTAERRRHCD